MRAFAVLLIMLIILPAAAALSFNDVIINATGTNLSITADIDLNMSALEVTGTSIYIYNLTYSNPLQSRGSDLLSYNITDEANVNYPSTQLPYISLSTTQRKVITSNLSGVVNGSIIMAVPSCSVLSITMDSASSSEDYTWSSTEFSCAANMVTLNYTGIAKGINNLFIDQAIATNCTSGNISMTFNIYDEDQPTTRLVADAEVEFNYWKAEDPSYVSNFTVYFSGANNYSICLSNNVSTLLTDLYIKYNTTGGFTHRYILVNNTLSAMAPQTLSIYNFADSTGVTDLRITARYNSDYKYYPNVIAKLQKQYVSEGVWRTVQMDKSGDFGLLFFNIREEDNDYKIIFTDMQNNILKTTDSMKFSCTSGICDLTVLLDPFSATAGTSGLSTSYTFNKDTNMVSVAWTDSLAGTNTVELLAKQYTATGTAYLCNETQVGSSGSMSCDLAGRSGAVTLQIKGNGATLINEILDVTSVKLGVLLGNTEGALWAVILMVTCVMFGIFSVVGAVIAMMISLVVIYLLGIFTPITVTFLIIAAVIGIWIGFKVRK
jgi:hypothetical protein